MHTDTDDARFRALVREHGTSLLRMCSVYLGDKALAEDAVQDAFLKAYRTLAQFRGECSDKTWLARIAINTCKNYLRNPWHRYVDRRVSLETLPERATGGAGSDMQVLREISRLPDNDKAVILLTYYQDMRASDVARALGISREAVYARLKRARAKLKTKLEGWYINE